MPDTTTTSSNLPHKLQLAIPFPDAKAATTAAEVLCVDREVSAHQIQTTFATEAHTLQVTFAAANLRILRIATNSFFDMLTMVTRTMEAFNLDTTD
ncbi:hypothetical protein IWQ60_007763 [Tieghemiomyces parasiticus]|uniref:Transcription factor Pcc1 n=1 Tax=Tieghemiomyces parasiticus TaxID=78921 RepID=A0A9W7ZVM2_9FUNG|nr:hypothetical protein IWQ60_007763 [Tieghemiomyces parasiticus]